MRVGLAIPHWGDNEHRQRNYETVLSELRSLYPWTTMCLLPSDSEKKWNRGSARNHLVQVADERRCDVVVLCDSDIIPEVGPLHQAIQGAYDHGGLHFPFDKYRYLSQSGTNQYLDGNPIGAQKNVYMEGPGSLGGIMAVKPSEWLDIGGSPELDGWGFEDVIYAVCSRTLLRDNSWYPGRILHLWHPSDCQIGSPEYDRNIAVCKRYEAASGDKAAIWDLINGRRVGVNE